MPASPNGWHNPINVTKLKYAQNGKQLTGVFAWSNQTQLTIPIPFPGFKAGSYVVGAVALYTQKQTLTINTAVDSTVYRLTINRTTVQVTSGVGATTTTIAAQLVAAVQANAGLNALVTIANVGAVITVTARNAGQGFTLVGDSRSSVGAAGVPSLPGFTVTDYQDGQFTLTATSAYTGSLLVSVSSS